MPIYDDEPLFVDLLKGISGFRQSFERLRYHSLYFDEKALYCVLCSVSTPRNEEDQSYSQHQMNLFSIYVHGC
jgi:trehalose-6-phosphate synthase